MFGPFDTRNSLAMVGALALMMASAPSATAQVVQLPTFEFFGVSTTVLVPDRGGLNAAGVGRSRRSSARRGFPVGPAAGDLFASRGAGGVGVTATVHDLDAMDRALLGNGPRAPLAKANQQRPHAKVLAERGPASSSAERGAESLASIRAARSIAGGTASAEARKFFQQAEEARNEGGAALARMYYQMAARRATGELSGKIAARLATLR
ncbi:MAG: hypothetical protein WD468_08545 [Pirellulales bacterium]